MKRVAILFLLIVTINAQQNDILKSKYGYREFDGPTFENNTTEKSVTKLPALLKSSIVNSNPEFLSATSDSVTWDATNDLGQQVGAGVYLYQLQTKDFVKTRKMVLLK